MRTRQLLALGFSKHRQAAAVSADELIRVGRSWLALPLADAQLMAAARAGVVLTCVTQAKRLGLWVLREDGVHVAAPTHAGHVAATRATVHWARPLVPRH